MSHKGQKSLPVFSILIVVFLCLFSYGLADENQKDLLNTTVEDGSYIEIHRTTEDSAPSLNRTKMIFVTTTANTLASIKKAAEDASISQQIEASARIVSQEVPESYMDLNLSDQDVVMLVHLGYPIQDGIRAAVENAKQNGAHVIVYKFEDLSVLANVNTSDPQYVNITEYWDYGGEENARRLISFLGSKLCNLSLEVLPPVPAPLYGIYHPDAPGVFSSTGDYLDWYNSSGRFDPARPTVGIISYSIPGEDMIPTADALIRSLEEEGANAIFGTYTYKDANSTFLFTIDNQSVVDAVVTLTSFRLHNGDEERGTDYLCDLNVTPLKAITSYYSSPKDWANGTGLSPAEIPWQIALPELDGMAEFDLLSVKAKDLVSGLEFNQPVDYQVAWIAKRAAYWGRLHQMNNSEKKVAVIYYNHGGGKDNLGASYLDIAPSLKNLLEAMNESGYRIEGQVPEERKLLDLMLLQGRNVGSWAPEELRRMVEEGDLILLPEEEYLSWFNDDRIISPEARARVVERWGQPPGEIMVYKNQSGSYLVIPRLIFGNIILAPQPSRGWLENQSLLYHDKELVPHHQYIAFYLWLKYGFGADATIHFGTHGTQEWLPGKETALSAKFCWPAMLIQDLPVVYPYIMDNVGEGTQAKRRGNAVIVDHLTPPLVASGLYGNLSLLHEKMHQYTGLEEAVRAEVKETIAVLYKDLNLSEDLGVPATSLQTMNSTEFEGFLDVLHRHLHELEDERIPFGLHILGEPPQGAEMISMVRSMLGDKFIEDIAPIYSQEPSFAENWTVADDLIYEVAINGSSPAEAQQRILGNVSARVSEDLNLSAVYAENLSRCEIEVPRVLAGLAGRYVPPKVGNDPIRNPDALPTGNNFYSFDSRLIPGEEAWSVGKAQAEDLVARYQQEHDGSYPRKTAFVLWAVETMRHQGVVESEILQLLGVKPVWDSKGRISDVEMIPSEELGRPRIDVLITASGLYRDTFPDKIALLDKAVRLAAKANDTAPNYVKENSEDILDKLLAGGYNQSEAENLSSARIFSEALGTYGTGLPDAVTASDTWENDTKLADLYISRVGNVYGASYWGASEKDLFSQNLEEVEVGVHSDSSNLYGAIDNDDFFQYLGGLSLAVRSVSGEDPDLYVTNLREPGDPRMESLKGYFKRELAARYFNPRWIAGMQEHGYAGAREMDKFVENLWGWEATVPDLVTESTWNEVYDVYVADKYDLGLKEFFDQNNPYAYQALSGRMLETARKERWHPLEEIKEELIEQYEQSVEDYGVTCCHHTCGNLLLQEYMQGVLPSPEPEKSSHISSSSRKSSSSKSSSSRHSSTSEKPDSDKPASYNQTQPAGVGSTTAQQPMEIVSDQGEVEGFVMEAAEMENSNPSITGAPLLGIALVLIVMLVIAAGFRRKS